MEGEKGGGRRAQFDQFDTIQPNYQEFCQGEFGVGEGHEKYIKTNCFFIHFAMVIKNNNKTTGFSRLFHNFPTPDQIILDECCPHLRIPEHSELIDKLKTVEITQGFSYFFHMKLNGFCSH